MTLDRRQRALLDAERERCATIAERWRSPYGGPRDLEVAQAIAEAIRAASDDA